VRSRSLAERGTRAQVFVVEVTTDDGRHYKVTKSYDDFYAFHTALIKQYPEEAGLTGKRRTLPDLPVQAIHVTESFAVVQQRDFDRYVKVRTLTRRRVRRCDDLRFANCAV